MKKKRLLTLIIGLCFIVLTGYVVIGEYAQTYSINNNRQAIINKIQIATSKFQPATDHVDLKLIVDIENEKHVLFVSDKFEGIGNAILTKGINGKLKIDGISWGGNLFEYHVNKIKNKKYWIAYGRNYNRKIDHIKLDLEGKDYKLQVPNQDYYIVYCSVLENRKIGASSSYINLYDKSGNDLTAFIFGKLPKTPIRSYFTSGNVEDKSFLGTFRHGFGLVMVVIYGLLIGVILHRIMGFIGSGFKFSDVFGKLFHRL